MFKGSSFLDTRPQAHTGNYCIHCSLSTSIFNFYEVYLICLSIWIIWKFESQSAKNITLAAYFGTSLGKDFECNRARTSVNQILNKKFLLTCHIQHPNNPNKQLYLWNFCQNRYGLLGIRNIWVFCKSLCKPTWEIQKCMGCLKVWVIRGMDYWSFDCTLLERDGLTVCNLR